MVENCLVKQSLTRSMMKQKPFYFSFYPVKLLFQSSFVNDIQFDRDQNKKLLRLIKRKQNILMDLIEYLSWSLLSDR